MFILSLFTKFSYRVVHAILTNVNASYLFSFVVMSLHFVVPCEPYSNPNTSKYQNPNTSECLHIRDDFSIRSLVTFNTDTDYEVC